MTTPRANADRLTILFTCVGRRIELLQAFRAAAGRLNVGLRIVGTDQDATAPGLSCADEAVLVPTTTDGGYIPALEKAVRGCGAAALVPTIDQDLLGISEHRAAFDALGCKALIGPPEVIRVCRDKIQTYAFLRQNGIDTPATWLADEVRALPSHRFPYFLKPRYGSASHAVHKINDEIDLEYFLRRGRDPIVQEFVEGVEHTLDAYVGLTGQVRCVVPRRRWQVRGGEVSKGVVVKDERLMQAAKRVVEALSGDLRGVVTLQCIVTPAGEVRFIEINPRFGGGAPLSIAAGADFPAWLIEELLGREPAIVFEGFRHGLSMLRYDWSAFLPLDADLKPRIVPPLRGWPRFE